MKPIIDKIYTLIQNPADVPEAWSKELGDSIGTMLRDRLQEKPRDNVLRMSNLGRGNRFLWYEVRPETPQEELRPEVRLKFMFGDIIELVFIALIKLVGHKVTHEQAEVELDGIKGHIDCLVDGELIDVKSASSFSFIKFKKEELQMNDPFGYYPQLAAYAQSMKVPAAGWLVWDKQLGHMCFSRAFEQYLPDMKLRIAEVKEKVAQRDEPAPCAYPVAEGKAGNMKLATTCSYCKFNIHCWRESNEGHGLRTFLYAKGVVHFTHIALLPKVPEVTNSKE